MIYHGFSAGRYGGFGSKRQLRRRRSTVQERRAGSQVPDRTRRGHQLGRHGKAVAPHVLQRAPSRPRGALRPAHRGAAQPQKQPRENDTGESR